MQIKHCKTGGVIAINNVPHIIENIDKHTPSARGAATIYKIRCRNLITQSKIDISGKGEDEYAEPDFRHRAVQYLYNEGDDYIFMDAENYEQFFLDKSIVDDDKYYLTDGMEDIYALILDERIVGITLPDVVEQKLIQCDPAIKGQSATNRGKMATTETGFSIQVPEYMEQDEVVRIDTRNGKFLGRVGTSF